MRDRGFPVLLKFVHLYDDKYAAFRGTRLPRRRREVIFPDGFEPEEGKEYECNVRRTLSGVFHYEGEDFDVCYAQ